MNKERTFPQYHKLWDSNPIHFETNSVASLLQVANKYKGDVDEYGMTTFQLNSESSSIAARGSDNGWAFEFTENNEESPLHLLATIVKNAEGKKIPTLFVGHFSPDENNTPVMTSWKRFEKEPSLDRRINRLATLLSVSISS